MGKVYKLTEAELSRACRKAYRLGARASAEKFDRLLERMHRLKELNGTTELFKHQWQESQHARSHGKFAPKGGGSGTTDTKPEVDVTHWSASPTAAASQPTSGQDHEPIPEAHLLEGLHAHVPAGAWAKVKDSVTRAAKRVHERLVLATPAILKLTDLLTTIESPDDLKVLGYTPVSGGVSGHQTPDALREATGIPGVIGAKLAAHVLARVVHWMNRGASPDEAVRKALAEVRALAVRKAFDPNEKRDAGGKWTAGGGAGKGKAGAKDRTAASEPAQKSGPELRGHLAGELRAMDGGNDDPRGYGSGPPPHVDMPKFTADVAGVVADHAAAFGGVGMHVAEAYKAVGEKYPGLSLDDFQRAVYQLFDERDVVMPGGDPHGIDYHGQTDERLRALIPYGSKMVGYLKPGADIAAWAASAKKALDPFAEAGEALADVLAVLAEEFGLEGELPDGEAVADALREAQSDPAHGDPHASAAVAMLDYAIHAAESGGDVQGGLDRIADALEEPEDFHDAIGKAMVPDVAELAAEMLAEMEGGA